MTDEIAIKEDTGIEYADGRHIKIVPASAMIPKGEHQTRTILKAATHYTDADIDDMDWAGEILDIMELVDEHFDERGEVEWDEDKELYTIKLAYPVEMSRGMPITHIRMKRPSGKDMLVEDDDVDVRLIIKRVASLCNVPRPVVRKMAWCDVRTCFDLFQRRK